MLLELRVENLLLIQRTELRLGSGLNVITGETGAGKTVLAGALDLLLGGKPPVGTVRPGADEAWVEGVFELPRGLLDAPELAELRERVPEGAEEIVLGRRVSARGRTSAFVQGRSATAADLRELGGRLVSFLGQHEHRRLTVAAAQLEVLDAFCGPEHLALRAAYLEARERVPASGTWTCSCSKSARSRSLGPPSPSTSRSPPSATGCATSRRCAARRARRRRRLRRRRGRPAARRA